LDSNVQLLEMFFSGLPRLISFHSFPNLLKLVIVNQNIERIEALDTCVNLRELWITECKLTVSTYLIFSSVICYLMTLNRVYMFYSLVKIYYRIVEDVRGKCMPSEYRIVLQQNDSYT